MGLIFRRRLLDWGATPEERLIPLPAGDRLLADGKRTGTMAITIEAPPSAVWPWLVQMGMGRGGWYSWDRLDNAGQHSAEAIVPQWQHLEVGDRLVSVAGGKAWFDVVHIEPERALCVRARIDMRRGRSLDPGDPEPRWLVDSTWEFLLRPLDDDRTRLVVSGREHSKPRWVSVPAAFAFWDPAHVLMQLKQLRELKRRVEAAGSETGMYVHESGTPGAPAVVFLQGAGASGRMWREHMASLAGRFHCLAPDLPGFGRSNHLPCRSRTETADLVAELIETRVPARRAHVVGLSWGGAITYAVLERHPDLLDRVVIDGAGVLPWWGGNLILAGVSVVSPFLHTRPVIGLFSDIIGMDEEGRADLRASSRWAFQQAFIEGFKTRPSNAHISAGCPTLLVAGEKETVVRPSNAALASLMPNAVARFAPGLGHGWLARTLELHVHMVEAWLAGSELPSELIPEGASASAVARMLRMIGVPRPGS